MDAMEEMRRDLAAATRMLTAVDILEYSGHLSARLEDGESFLIQPRTDVRAELDPARLMVVDLDGKVISGDALAPSEVFIHAEIYKVRPDVGAVAHFHHDPTTVFSMVADRPLVPVKNHAARWAEGVPTYPHPWHVDDVEKGKALAQDLGSAHALMVRGHGQVVVAEDVKALFADVVHFVENASALARAHALGPVVPLSDEDCEGFLATFKRANHARKLWSYYSAVYDSGS